MDLLNFILKIFIKPSQLYIAHSVFLICNFWEKYPIKTFKNT